jgi:hypothetical protein
VEQNYRKDPDNRKEKGKIRQNSVKITTTKKNETIEKTEVDSLNRNLIPGLLHETESCPSLKKLLAALQEESG